METIMTDDPRWNEYDMQVAEALAHHLKMRSKAICADNGCTDDNHKCESYAYIRFDMKLLDICGSDYFQGCSKPHAAISLPWDGSAVELLNEVDEQCADLE